MWKKIKDWFITVLDLDRDGKVTAEDLELAEAVAKQELKKANQAINDQITDAVTQVKKKVGRKPKK